VLLDIVRTSVQSTFSAILGETPVEREQCGDDGSNMIVGVISFVGTDPWTLSCGFGAAAAEAIAMKFCGMDLPFDSGDMGDVIAELINVLAGDVVAQADLNGVKIQMSLPTVARGRNIEFLTERDRSTAAIEFNSNCGPFHASITTCSTMARNARMPGRANAN
jgi:CheY-specific phosphatase CheX